MSDYVRDPEFGGDLDEVREHYRRLYEVYDSLATLGETYPTLGFAGNAGWYQDQAEDNVDTLEAGWTDRARCTTFERDWSTILEDQLGARDRDRELFNISSWKEPESPYRWRSYRYDDGEREWEDDEKPTPGYDDLRGFGFWCDLDLADKQGRADLTDEELATVEAAQRAVIEGVADLYDVDGEDVYALDSGGGAYVYGPPEAALPVADYLDEPELGWLFNDVREQMRDEFAPSLWADVVDEAPGADELLDPDWIQNVNRQTKAPGAIHHDHDLVVTPLRARDPRTGALAGTVDYTPTLVSEISEAEVAELEAWADGLTAVEHTDAVASFVENLYPDLAAEADGWREVVDERVDALRAEHEERRARLEERREQIEAWADDEGTTDTLDRPDSDTDTDSAAYTTPTGAYSGVGVVTDRAEQQAAIESIDVREVVKEHAADRYNTSSRPHETTFDPSWRTSGSGKSCAIPNGENGFIDNGCDAGGGPVTAYALGNGYLADPTHSLGDDYGDVVDEMRAEGYNIPVWVPDATSEEYDETPLWAVRNGAVALEVLEPGEFVERETDDGETYPGFPDAETYNAALDALEDAGVDHGREYADAAADPDSDVEDGWEYVRDVYELVKSTPGAEKGRARQAAQAQLERETDWMYVVESERLWVYDEDSGTFGKYGEAAVGALLVEQLGEYYTTAEKNEIVDRVKQSNQVRRAELNARDTDRPLVCVGNGVVDLETGELLQHAPRYRFVRGLEYDYPTAENGLGADEDAVLAFLDDITEREADRDTLLDHLAHGLMPGHPYRAFVVCYGPGGNGKTQLSKLFRGFVGDDNAASVEIDELVEGDFATSDLVGKFLNWGDDMSGDGGGELSELSKLKKASGASSIRSNEKFEKTFDFVNEAALFFSANEPPRIGETKASIKDRLYPIRMPFRFEDDPDPENPMEKEKVPAAAERLLEDDAAMRGLLKLAVEHAQGLRERRGRYSMPEGPEERFRSYNQRADPIVRFANLALESGAAGDKVAKGDVYHVYRQVMDVWEERTTNEDSFRRQLPRCIETEVESGRSRALAPDDEDRVYVWKRLSWSDEGQVRERAGHAPRRRRHGDRRARRRDGPAARRRDGPRGRRPA